MNQPKINHVAVLVSTVLCFVIGGTWYGPLFQDQWLTMVHLDLETVNQNPPSAGAWITNVLSAVVPLYVMAWLFGKLNITTGVKGAVTAFVLVFAFYHLPTMTAGMFSKFPYGLAWLTGGFEMVSLTLGGFIIGAWQKK
ncbi:MAG TPA: DUF1761 domain-containing protein [Cyclobacteriaceae bacterium]|nr:DUF1761 domain-containing protein [Cyclobacteriaceae bacterium]